MRPLPLCRDAAAQQQRAGRTGSSPSHRHRYGIARTAPALLAGLRLGGWDVPRRSPCYPAALPPPFLSGVLAVFCTQPGFLSQIKSPVAAAPWKPLPARLAGLSASVRPPRGSRCSAPVPAPPRRGTGRGTSASRGGPARRKVSSGGGGVGSAERGGPTEPPSPLQGGMSAAKPKRIKFSDEEKFLILEEFSLRKDILIPKSGRYRNTQDRQRAWEEIAAAVNALSPVVRRTAEEIRKKWHNMVLDARRELAADKHPLLRQRPQERLFHHIFALFNKAGPPPAPSFGLPAAAPELLPHGPPPDRFPGPEERPLPGAESRLRPNPGPAAPRAAPPQGAAPGPPPGNPEPPRVKCPPSPALAWPCLEAMASPASLGTGSPGPPEPPHENGERPPIRAGAPDPIPST